MFFYKLSTRIVFFVICLCIYAQVTEAQLSQKPPLAARVALSKAGVLLQKQNYDGAIDVLKKFQNRAAHARQLSKGDPRGYHHPEIYFTLGNCHIFKKEYTLAAAAYRKCVLKNPVHHFAWLNLAKAAYELKNYAEAGRSFSKGYAAASQKQPEHLYLSATAYLMAEQYTQSIAAFDRLINSHPDKIEPKWKQNLVHALLAANQPHRALPYIKELARVFTGEKKIQWQEFLLYHYLQMDMRAQALSYARMLTRESPDFAKWWKALAHIQLACSRYKDALVSLTIYAWLNPLSDEEHKLLADLNLQAGIPVKAVGLYESLLNRKPDKRLLKNLVAAYRKLERYDTALERLTAFGLSENDPELLILKADLYYISQNYQTAAKWYRIAAKAQCKQAGRAWLMAGYCAWQTNDFVSSRLAFKRAAAFEKQKKAATDAIRQLDTF
ncbi:MAG: tetratricopeptide repeat protein [Desulfobacteraceae bacterium]|nr:tetratricopeptide repeat protein [Desulfobacteraceae bacterium]